MTFKEMKYLINSDIYRYHGRTNFSLFMKEFLWGTGSKFSIWLRISAYLRQKGLPFFPFYLMARLFHRRNMFKFGMDIHCSTQIASGLYIGHFGTIVVSNRSIIGKNCNLSHGVTIGAIFYGPRSGAPVIGDNVYFGPGSKVIGNVTIGNNVAIGANCVVTHDVPENSVVVGIPEKIVSNKGSEGYILHTDYKSANM